MVTVDPGQQQVLDLIEATGAGFDSDLGVEAMRSGFASFGALTAGQPPVGHVEDRVLTGPGGGDLALRCYCPDGVEAPGLLVWFHGGGFVIGDLETTDGLCRRLCAGSGAAVLSVDYRLAPEHPYPAALEDAWAALEWAAAAGDDLGVDPGRLAVGGDSAGGNLAALVAQRARDCGGPRLVLQLLVYPVTDLTMGHPSITENGEGYFLTRASMAWFTDHYLGTAREHGDPADPAVSPLAGDLSGLAPAHVVTAELDPLRDEGDAYARALTAAGVEVDHAREPGFVHAFAQMTATSPAATEAVDRMARGLGDALAH